MEEFRHCPQCGAPSTKAMYAGFPMWMCTDMVSCCCVFGGCSRVMLYLPFNGVMIRYWHYWPTLWALLSGRINREENS